MAENPYDRVVAPPANPYDDIVRDDRATRDAAVRTSVQQASQQPADRAAEARTYGERYGLPPTLVEHNLETYRARARVDDAATVVDGAPRLGAWLAKDPQNAAVAHDDLANLSALERTLGVGRNLVGAMGAGIMGFSQGVWGAAEAGLETLPALLVAGAKAEGSEGLARGAELAGVIAPGNVDLVKQPRVRNADGSTSTVDSHSYEINGQEVLLPSVTPDGRHLTSDADILAEYQKTGRHLGIFASPEQATTYAEQLHADYAAGKYDQPPLNERLAGLARDIAVTAGSLADRARGQQTDAGFVERGIYGGVESIGQMAPGLLIGALTGGSSMLATMGVTTGGQAYTQARAQGVTPGKALGFGTIQGVVEVATEWIPAHRLLKDLAVNAPLVKMLMHQAVSEIPGEEVATLLQDLNEWAVLPANKNATFNDYLAARPSQAAATLISTITAVGLTTVAAHGTSHVLEQLGEAATASKTRERTPAAVEAFVADAVKDSGLSHVYAPVQAWTEWFQSQGLDPAAIATKLTGDPQAYQAAVETGTDLAIPTGAYTAHLAATEHHKGLAPDLRLAPDQMNEREAEAFQEQVKAAQQAASEPGAPPAAADVAAQLMVGRLVAAGVPQDTADTLGEVWKAGIGTMAAKAGLDTPTELLARYGPGGGPTVTRPDLQTKTVADGAKTVTEGAPANVPRGTLSPEQRIRQLETELRGAQRAAETDALTGVANRAALDKALPAAEADPNTAVIAFDANNFGQVNKQVGHEAGDTMLKDMAAAIVQAATEQGLGERVFRRGGDEFVVLAPTKLAEGIRARAEVLFGSQAAGQATVSLSGSHGTTFAAADATLQASKNARKDLLIRAAEAASKPRTGGTNVSTAPEAGAGPANADRQRARVDEGGVQPGAGEGDRAVNGGVQAVARPGGDPDELFDRRPLAETQARLTPDVRREVQRIYDELDNFRPTSLTVIDRTLEAGPKQGKTGGGNYDAVAGSPGAEVAADVIWLAPQNKGTKGRAVARQVRGSHGEIMSAAKALLETGDAKNNLAEGVLRVAERRNAGEWKGLSQPSPPSWGEVVPPELEAALDAGLDAGPTADLLSDEQAITDGDLAGTGYPTSWDEFDQSLLDELDADAQAQAAPLEPAVDTLTTGESQPRLPDVGGVRDQNVPTPVLEAPFSLTPPASKGSKGVQTTLFQETPAPLDKPAVKAFAAALREQFGADLEAFDLYLANNGNIHLDTIAVRRGAQRAGLGTQVMLELVKFADQHQARISLSPAERGYYTGTTSKGRLVAFYKRFGFVENSGRHKDFTTRDAMYRYPTKQLASPVATPAFRTWFKQSAVVDANGAPLVVYHGTARGDRVGNVFRKNRATSGPMAFFTADRAIAEKYSQQKQDTSLEPPDDYRGWFTFKPAGSRSSVDLQRAWYHLTEAERATVLERLPTVGYENADQADGPIVADSSSIASKDHIDYLLREARGNGLEAAKELWLSSGSLFDQEARFLDVLKGLGLEGRFALEDPHAEHPKVIDAYLSIQRPLVTNAIAPDVIAALEKRAARQPRPAERGADFWDKSTRDAREWVQLLKDDLAKGDSSFVWSSVPDWVTKTLEELGYDGIRDTGGKLGGPVHEVWIPFEPTQIKSASGNRGTFDPGRPSILYQETPAAPTFFSRLTAAVQASQLGKASGAQWKATITNAKIGINRDEFALVGVGDLEDGTVYSKQAVLDYLAAHAVVVEDVTLGDGPSAKQKAALEARTQEVYDRMVDEEIQRIEENGDYGGTRPDTDITAEEDGGFSATVDGEDLGYVYDTEAEAQAAADEEAERLFEKSADDQGDAIYEAARNNIEWADAEREAENERNGPPLETQYGDYVEPGADKGSYREVFLTAPSRWAPIVSSPTVTLEKMYEDQAGPIYEADMDGQRWMDPATGKPRALIFGYGHTEADMRAMALSTWRAEHARAEPTSWEDGHDLYAGIENPIVRLRFDTRTLGREGFGLGQRVLFLEEVQPPHADAPVPELFAKNWRELAFKWALRYAAEHNLDAVAWTTGAMQAARYSLEKQVERIDWATITPDSPTYYDAGARQNVVVTTRERGNRTIGFNVNEKGVVVEIGADHAAQAWVGAPLESILGKEIAGQIAAGPTGNVSGEGLKVGGGGLKKLYDVDFRNVVQKLPAVKKHGGQVEELRLPVPAKNSHAMRAIGIEEYPDGRGWGLRLTNNVMTQLYDTEAVAAAALEEWNADTERTTTPVMAVKLTPALREAVLGGQALFQDEDTPAPVRRGAIRFGPDRQFDIQLFAKADLSTFLHETGHFFLEVYGDLVDRVGALPLESLTDPQRKLLADYGAILQHLGVDNRAAITTAQHEQFARAFEAYLMEGRAPSLELRSAFGRFRAWLLGVYKSIRRLNVELTPEVRGVFDRMLASDRAIAEAAQAGQVAPLFMTAEAAGMSAPQFALYVDTIAEASRVAREKLEAQLLGEVQREQTAAWKAQRADIREAVAAGVYQQPVYQALAAMRRGTHPDGSPLVAGLETAPMKLSRAAILQVAGPEGLKRLPPFVHVVEGGVHPDTVAQLFGFSSGAALLTAISDAPPMRAAIEHETDRQMIATHGSLLLDGTLHEKAQAAVVNAEQDQVLRAEIRALRDLQRTARPFVVAGEAALAAERKERSYERRWFDAEAKLALAIQKGEGQAAVAALQQQVRQLRALARSGAVTINAALPSPELLQDTARTQIGATQIRALKPTLYWSAAVRASQQATNAAARQDFAGAIAAKTQELINHALYRESLRVVDDVTARVQQAKDLGTTAARQRLGLAGASYLEQVDGILDRYEFATVPAKTLEKRARIRDWVEALEAQGLPVEDLTPEVLDDSRRVNYKDITVDELVGVTDGLKQILHLARLKTRLLKAADTRDFETRRDAIVTSIRANTAPREKVLEFRPADQKWRTIAGWFASHRKLADIGQALDGYASGGPVWEAFVHPTNVAADAEEARKSTTATAYAAILNRYYPGRQLARLNDKLEIPAIGGSLSYEGRLAVALNWGNETSRARLLADPARRWSRPQIDAILDTLDARDWQFVQATWDHINTFWPEIAAKMERVTGLAPDKVAAVPVRTKFGDLAGGYYPLAYDGRLSPRAAMNEAASQAKLAVSAAYIRTTTKRGHTITRLQNVQLPVRLELSVAFAHFEQVIHDLTHHEMLIDAQRLLRDPQVTKAIVETAGDITFEQMTRAYQDIAIGSAPAAHTLMDKGANYIRTGTQIAGLGWNLWTGAQQPLGLFNGAAHVGPTWVARGLTRWLRDAASMENTSKWIASVSPMMANRTNTATQDLHDLRASFRQAGGWFDTLVRTVSADHVTQQTIGDSFLWHIGLMQRVADVPTWLGQYEKSMAAGEPEARAYALADQAVLDSQGGGQIKDLSQFQRGGPIARLYLTFYSYGATVFNATSRAAGQTNFRSPRSVAEFLGNLSLIYVAPALATIALSRAFGRSGGDDDDLAQYLQDVGRETLATALNTMVFVRELGGLVQQGTRGYEGPAGARAFSLVYNLAQQVKQGEADDALWHAANAVAGVLFRYPAAQVQRTVDGAVALEEGRTTNPLALLFGEKRKGTP